MRVFVRKRWLPMVKQGSANSSGVGEAELLLLAQAGDDRAFTMLVALYEPMLRAQVAHFRFPRADADDMAQEGLLGLLSAVRTFSPEKSASFRTYAAVCVRNRLLSAWRRTAARAAEVPVEDTAAVMDSLEASSVADPAALLVEREAAEDFLERMRKSLSNREYAVLLRYLNGFSYGEIAAELQVSSKAVDNALQRARQKLQSNRT